MSPIWMGCFAKNEVKVAKCCFASISVGHMYPIWRFPKSWPCGREVTTAYAAAAATAVFPLPTSPSSKRCMG